MDRRAIIKSDRYDGLTREEKAAAMRAELYATHKARGSLGTYYWMYPEERPPRPVRDQSREDGERGR